MSNDPSDIDDPGYSEERERSLQRRRRDRAALPAPFIDDWATLTWEGHVRITLGEFLYGNPNYRFALVMDLGSAEEFAEDLLRIVRDRKNKDKQKQGNSKDSSVKPSSSGQ